MMNLKTEPTWKIYILNYPNGGAHCMNGPDLANIVCTALWHLICVAKSWLWWLPNVTKHYWLKTLLEPQPKCTLRLKTDPYPTWKLYILKYPNGEPIAWMAQIWPILCAPHCGTSRVWPNHDYDDYRGWQNHVACQIAYEWMGCQAKCVQHIDICNCFFRAQSRFDFQSWDI